MTIETQKWYAIRSVPGAQQPKRHFHAEGRRSAKGYRMVPTINPDISAVEDALSREGFEHFMPSERRLIRDRHKTGHWKARRFALLIGYVFVCNPRDFQKLEQVPGVLSVIRDGAGVPVEISLKDILALRTREAEAEQEFERAALAACQKRRAHFKRDPFLEKLVERLETGRASARLKARPNLVA